MRPGRRRCLAWSASALVLPGMAAAQTPAPAPAPPVGELKPLGQDRFQIGRVVVDRRAGTFTVPGRVLSLGKPLEYLATSPGGAKAYETLFELDATGSEFNLGCILLGLERHPDHSRARTASAGPLLGPRVAIFITWTDNGKAHKVSAAEAMLNPDAGIRPEVVEWVYAGSPGRFASDGFLADVRGTLVGFKRDEGNVIESALPIGVGAYGSVRGHPMLPPNGSPIELVVVASPAAK